MSAAAEAKPRETRSPRRRAIDNGRRAGVNVAGGGKETESARRPRRSRGRRAKRASRRDGEGRRAGVNEAGCCKEAESARRPRRSRGRRSARRRAIENGRRAGVNVAGCCKEGRMSAARRTHPFVFLVLILPFGVMSGYLTVAVAYLLTRAGVSVEQIAELIAVSFIPQTWKFLWSSRRVGSPSPAPGRGSPRRRTVSVPSKFAPAERHADW